MNGGGNESLGVKCSLESLGSHAGGLHTSLVQLRDHLVRYGFAALQHLASQQNVRPGHGTSVLFVAVLNST